MIFSLCQHHSNWANLPFPYHLCRTQSGHFLKFYSWFSSSKAWKDLQMTFDSYCDREKDANCVFFDQFVAMPICFLGVRNILALKILTWRSLIVGFVIFRSFEIPNHWAWKTSRIYQVVSVLLTRWPRTGATWHRFCEEFCLSEGSIRADELGHYCFGKKRALFCQHRLSDLGQALWI
jgi:hypothetical protein